MGSVQLAFDPDIDAYIVTLPDSTSLEALRVWGSEFIAELGKRRGNNGLLFDSNTHQFESIECLKWLKKFLAEEKAIADSIDRVAFVQPPEFRGPGTVSEAEAYFGNVEDARKWLISLREGGDG